MPELPEVEVVKNDLKSFVVNKKITKVYINDEKIIKFPVVEEFQKKIINQQVYDILRVGKYLIFVLDDYVLASHLRMEGKYLFGENLQNMNVKHNMITFQFDNKYSLLYLDTRKFGTMHLLSKEDYMNNLMLSKLGLDPFNEKLNVEYLNNAWKNKHQKIKTALLNQTYISGIGNIYADEILFKCKIHPLTEVRFLTENDLKNIILNTKDILKTAIKYKGTRIKSFESVNHNQGEYRKFLQVHFRLNKPCFVCQNMIQKIIVNGRGTYYCNNCQKD